MNKSNKKQPKESEVVKVVRSSEDIRARFVKQLQIISQELPSQRQANVHLQSFSRATKQKVELPRAKIKGGDAINSQTLLTG